MKNCLCISVKVADDLQVSCRSSSGCISRDECWDYEYKSDNSKVNMTCCEGAIFRARPNNWYCETYVDCTVANMWYTDASNQDFLAGIEARVTYHNYRYILSCERKVVTDDEVVEGVAPFELRKEICGDNPTPDNINIPIKGLEDKSTDPWNFGCGIKSASGYFFKYMTNSLVTRRMPNIKGAKASFHQVCGAMSDEATPCSLKIQEITSTNEVKVSQFQSIGIGISLIWSFIRMCMS